MVQTLAVKLPTPITFTIKRNYKLKKNTHQNLL